YSCVPPCWRPASVATTEGNGGDDVSNKTAPTDAAIPTDRDELWALVKRAEKGDAATLPALRKLVQDPANVHLFGGGLAETVESSFIKGLGGENLVFRTALSRKLEVMRAELLGSDPTPVERLLVERVVACWLQVQDAEVRFAQGQGNLSIKQADYYQRR